MEQEKETERRKARRWNKGSRSAQHPHHGSSRNGAEKSFSRARNVGGGGHGRGYLRGRGRGKFHPSGGGRERSTSRTKTSGRDYKRNKKRVQRSKSRGHSGSEDDDIVAQLKRQRAKAAALRLAATPEPTSTPATRDSTCGKYRETPPLSKSYKASTTTPQTRLGRYVYDPRRKAYFPLSRQEQRHRNQVKNQEQQEARLFQLSTKRPREESQGNNNNHFKSFLQHSALHWNLTHATQNQQVHGLFREIAWTGNPTLSCKQRFSIRQQVAAHLMYRGAKMVPSTFTLKLGSDEAQEESRNATSDSDAESSISSTSSSSYSTRSNESNQQASLQAPTRSEAGNPSSNQLHHCLYHMFPPMQASPSQTQFHPPGNLPSIRHVLPTGPTFDVASINQGHRMVTLLPPGSNTARGSSVYAYLPTSNKLMFPYQGTPSIHPREVRGQPQSYPRRLFTVTDAAPLSLRLGPAGDNVGLLLCARTHACRRQCFMGCGLEDTVRSTREVMPMPQRYDMPEGMEMNDFCYLRNGQVAFAHNATRKNVPSSTPCILDLTSSAFVPTRQQRQRGPCRTSDMLSIVSCNNNNNFMNQSQASWLCGHRNGYISVWDARARFSNVATLPPPSSLMRSGGFGSVLCLTLLCGGDQVLARGSFGPCALFDLRRSTTLNCNTSGNQVISGGKSAGPLLHALSIPSEEKVYGIGTVKCHGLAVDPSETVAVAPFVSKTSSTDEDAIPQDVPPKTVFGMWSLSSGSFLGSLPVAPQPRDASTAVCELCPTVTQGWQWRVRRDELWGCQRRGDTHNEASLETNSRAWGLWFKSAEEEVVETSSTHSRMRSVFPGFRHMSFPG